MTDVHVERVAEPLFLVGEIADGRAFLDAAGAADLAGLREQRFDQSGFAGAGVSEYRDVANALGCVRPQGVIHSSTSGRSFVLRARWPVARCARRRALVGSFLALGRRLL